VFKSNFEASLVKSKCYVINSVVSSIGLSFGRFVCLWISRGLLLEIRMHAWMIGWLHRVRERYHLMTHRHGPVQEPSYRSLHACIQPWIVLPRMCSFVRSVARSFVCLPSWFQGRIWWVGLREEDNDHSPTGIEVENKSENTRIETSSVKHVALFFSTSVPIVVLVLFPLPHDHPTCVILLLSRSLVCGTISIGQVPIERLNDTKRKNEWMDEGRNHIESRTGCRRLLQSYTCERRIIKDLCMDLALLRKLLVELDAGVPL